jgi:hypothetical protein
MPFSPQGLDTSATVKMRQTNLSDSNHILLDFFVRAYRNWLEVVMSTIQEVQAAEKKVQEVLRELKKTDLTSRDDLHQQLTEATDEYVRAIRELK